MEFKLYIYQANKQTDSFACDRSQLTLKQMPSESITEDGKSRRLWSPRSRQCLVLNREREMHSLILGCIHEKLQKVYRLFRYDSEGYP